jgi:hypothetical protein
VQGGQFPIFCRQTDAFGLATDIHVRMVAIPCVFVMWCGAS